MPDFDPAAYAISVQRVTEDGRTLFRATVRELPDLVDYGQTVEEAYALAIESIETLNSMAQDEGRAFPRTIADDGTYSGRVTLRMPKSLHHKASIAADREGVSLNNLLVSFIAEAIGTRSADRPSLLSVVLSSTQRPVVWTSASKLGRNEWRESGTDLSKGFLSLLANFDEMPHSSATKWFLDLKEPITEAQRQE